MLSLRWMFYKNIRTNSDFCFIHHYLIGFYNRGGKCLLRGTDWSLIYSRLRLVFKRLDKTTEVFWKKKVVICYQLRPDFQTYGDWRVHSKMPGCRCTFRIEWRYVNKVFHERSVLAEPQTVTVSVKRLEWRQPAQPMCVSIVAHTSCGTLVSTVVKSTSTWSASPEANSPTLTWRTVQRTAT